MSRAGSILLVVALAIVVSIGVATVPLPVTAGQTTTNNTTGQTTTNNTTAPGFVEAYPNPVTYGDNGEFLTIAAPNETDLGAYRLADDHSESSLPNRTVEGRIVLTANRSAVPETVTGPRIVWSGMPRLANSGETLTLSGPDGMVDTVEYTDAPEGDVFRPHADRQWQPLGATSFDPVSGRSESVRAFTLPDSPGVPADLVDGANRRLLLAGYTFTSERIADDLIAAQRRGVEVEVLVDGAPVGGFTNRSAAVLDRLAAANVTVSVIGGEQSRYEFHHPKYAVADDQAVVLTENWKPAGVGGTSSRGWGAVVDSPAAVDGLIRTFRADTGWHDAISWKRFRQNRTFEPTTPTRGRYPARIDPESVSVDRVELLVAPDNAVGRVRGLLENATESIRIVQVSIGGRDDPLLRESIEAARRGVEVEILLSSAWYAREDNRELAQYLRTLADREDLPLSVKLADPGGRYEKIHAKGVIVDGDTVVLGSLNWNANAYHDNREVALVLHGEGAGSYYASVFERDWQGGITRVPVGLLAVVLLALALAGTLARRIDFRE